MARHEVIEQDDEKQLRAKLHASIGDQVMHILGQPEDLHCIQIRRLWENRYRVNVFMGPNGYSASIAHSFFLVTDSDAKIIAATPKITKKY